MHAWILNLLKLHGTDDWFAGSIGASCMPDLITYIGVCIYRVLNGK